MTDGVDAIGTSAGVDLKQLTQTSQNSPADMLKAPKTVATSHVVGHAWVHGASTTHYAGAIDFDKVAARISDPQSAAALKRFYSTSGMSSMPVDVWIDSSRRVRREGFKLSSSAVSMDMTIDFVRFGVPVDTTPPPSDQVMDASSLLGAKP